MIDLAEQDPKQEGEKFFTETSKSQMQSLIATGAATVAILTTLSMGRSDAQQISFQEFKNKLLEPGLVDRIEVTNKSLAKVYVYTGD